MDILTAQVARNLMDGAASPAVAPLAPLAPSPLATAQFADMMGVQSTTPLTPTAQAAQAMMQTTSAKPSNTLGDAILSGLQNMSNDFQQSWKAVSATLDANGPLTNTELLKLQMGVTQLSIQYDLVGKAISRSTQNIDQLVKMQ